MAVAGIGHVGGEAETIFGGAIAVFPGNRLVAINSAWPSADAASSWDRATGLPQGDTGGGAVGR